MVVLKESYEKFTMTLAYNSCGYFYLDVSKYINIFYGFIKFELLTTTSTASINSGFIDYYLNYDFKFFGCKNLIIM